MSLTVIPVTGDVNHRDSEKTFGYMQGVHDAGEILNGLHDELMMDPCFPALGSAGSSSHCHGWNLSVSGPVSSG